MGLKTRKIKVRDLEIGGGAPIAVQSMCATRTQDIGATLKQIEDLRKALLLEERRAVAEDHEDWTAEAIVEEAEKRVVEVLKKLGL